MLLLIIEVLPLRYMEGWVRWKLGTRSASMIKLDNNERVKKILQKTEAVL